MHATKESTFCKNIYLQIFVFLIYQTGILMMAQRIYFLRPVSSANEKVTENEHYLHEYLEENSEFCGINNAKSKFLMFYLC